MLGYFQCFQWVVKWQHFTICPYEFSPFIYTQITMGCSCWLPDLGHVGDVFRVRRVCVLYNVRELVVLDYGTSLVPPLQSDVYTRKDQQKLKSAWLLGVVPTL